MIEAQVKRENEPLIQSDKETKAQDSRKHVVPGLFL